MSTNLTTLARVKRYLGQPGTNVDALITELIPVASRTIEAYTSRQYPSVSRTGKRLTGSGTDILVLPDSPIVTVSALSIGGVAIPESNGTSGGYLADDTAVNLIAYGKFPMKPPLQVTCSWVAGYLETETDTIPTANTPTLTPTSGGRAVTAVSVTNVAGLSFTEVANSPVVNQFSLSEGVFTFNSSDSGTLVEMEYYYIPSQVEQACVEMIALDLMQRNNVGVKSKTLANETVSFEDRAMTPSVKEMLQPFRKYTL